MEYFYVNNESLSNELCRFIIEKFEIECTKYKTNEGMTALGLNKSIKHTTDFAIHNSKEAGWIRIGRTLQNELLYNLKCYCKNINEKYKTINYKVFNKDLWFSVFQVQRYTHKEGHYVYHHDFQIDNNSRRVLTYLWYLNDVKEGGETEMCADHKVTPQAGKLIIFPASEFYPHCALMPISEDKYIITGWVYTSN